MTNNLPANIITDIENINRIEAVTSILEVICRTTNMGFAAVARVTDDKWVACAVRDEIAFGLLPGGELVLETTICHEIRQNQTAVVIDHVTEDPVYSCHHTPEMYGFQSYISMPIILKDGTFFGTLCAIDPQPHQLNNPATINMFKLFAELIAFHIHANQQLTLSATQLSEERHTAELREQFIAILGHDLRNPVTAISNAAQLLMRMPADDRVKRLAHIMQDSTYRIKALIDNIMDFAHGRLGNGIILERKQTNDIASTLNHVINELRIISPEKIIETRFDLNAPVYADPIRIAQLFSNLLGNAITHGQKDAPVLIQAGSSNDGFTLSISNKGEKIPDSARERLFQPFYRGDIRPGQQGLGLGLYIAAEIARAHGGVLEVSSDANETIFTLTINA